MQPVLAIYYRQIGGYLYITTIEHNEISAHLAKFVIHNNCSPASG
jgi:hypothetical protein